MTYSFNQFFDIGQFIYIDQYSVRLVKSDFRLFQPTVFKFVVNIMILPSKVLSIVVRGFNCVNDVSF